MVVGAVLVPLAPGIRQKLVVGPRFGLSRIHVRVLQKLECSSVPECFPSCNVA